MGLPGGDGSKGEPGEIGAAGDAGSDGRQGRRGAKGTTGVSGLAGELVCSHLYSHFSSLFITLVIFRYFSERFFSLNFTHSCIFNLHAVFNPTPY